MRRRFCLHELRIDGSLSQADHMKPKAAAPGTVPDSFEQSTGLERAEIEIPDLFKHNEPINGPFGTEADPCLVESVFDSRIVGCTGME